MCLFVVEYDLCSFTLIHSAPHLWLLLSCHVSIQMSSVWLFTYFIILTLAIWWKKQCPTLQKASEAQYSVFLLTPRLCEHKQHVKNQKEYASLLCLLWFSLRTPLCILFSWLLDSSSFFFFSIFREMSKTSSCGSSPKGTTPLIL